MLRRWIGSASLVVLATPLAAQNAIGPFVGTSSEHFEVGLSGPYECTPVFSGRANLCQQLFDGLAVVLFYSTGCFVQPHLGQRMAIDSGAGLRITFDGDATEVGGYFATPWQSTGLTARFFGADGALIGSLDFSLPSTCFGWMWWGASSGSGANFRTVELVMQGNVTVCLDSLQANVVGSASYPAPVTYCTAKLTSGGCTPVIGTTYTGSAPAIPKVGYTSGFHVVASQMEPNKNGLFFYGVSGPNNAPFSCTGVLCVLPPIERTYVQSTGGGGACSGAFGVPWNSYVTSAPLAGDLGDPFAAGQPIWMQAWFRDPAACGASGLTDAVTFTMQ